MLMKKGWLLGIASLSLAISGGFLTAAEDAPKKTDAAAKAKDAEKKDADKSDKEAKDDEKPKEKKDPYAVPEDADSKEIMEFVNKLARRQRNFNSQEERMTHFTKLAETIVTATTKVLDDKDVEEDVAVEALSMHFAALNLKSQLGQKDAAKLELELAKKYAEDSRKPLAQMAKEKLLFAKFANIKDLKKDEQEKLVEEAVTTIKGDGKKLDQRSGQMAMMIGRILESVGEEALAAKALDQFAEIFAHADQEDLAKRFEGTAKRLRLIGNPIDIEGSLVDGNPIDWASYKGKVVLVDFWATWCGPCIGELPNVKRNYLGYHAKGFEIVGISLDNDQEALTSFIAENHLPWANLFSTDKEATGWAHPMATKYGVSSIPFTVLVGKDGNVIKMNVRGEALGEQLEKLLGPIDEDAIKAAEAAEEKLKEEEEKAKEEAAAKAKEEAKKKAAAKKDAAKKPADKEEKKTDEKKE